MTPLRSGYRRLLGWVADNPTRAAAGTVALLAGLAVRRGLAASWAVTTGAGRDALPVAGTDVPPAAAHLLAYAAAHPAYPAAALVGLAVFVFAD